MPARVPTDTVRLIRRFGATGYGVGELTGRFNLSRSCVRNILDGVTHANVVDDPDLPLLAEITPPPDPANRRRKQSAPAAPARSGDVIRQPSPPPRSTAQRHPDGKRHPTILELTLGGAPPT